MGSIIYEKEDKFYGLENYLNYQRVRVRRRKVEK